MRRQELRGVAVVLAAIMACALLPWAWAQGVGPLIPGEGLADISLGSRISETVARLGAPNAVQLVSTNGTLAYTFDQYGITAYTLQNVIVALTTTNSLLGMVHGVGLGSSRESVVAAFGAPRSVGLVEGFPGIMYESLGIGFGLDRHTVAVVLIFRAVASPVQPGVPPATPSAPAAPAVTSQAAPDEGVTVAAATGSAPVAPAAPAAPAPVATGPVIPLTSEDAAEVLPASQALGAPAPSLAAPPVTTIPGGGQEAGGGTGAIPDFGRLHPFTVETKFLSLAGYLRYFIYGMTRQWIGPKLSELVVRLHEGATAP